MEYLCGIAFTKYISFLQIPSRHEQIDTWRDLQTPFSGRDAISSIWVRHQIWHQMMLRLGRLLYVLARGDMQVKDGKVSLSQYIQLAIHF